MNREIKFRLWNGHKMIDPVAGGGEFGDKPTDLNAELRCIAELGVLMQSTGIMDRNGAEIFEGDIIGVEDNRAVGIVQFIDGAFRVKNGPLLCDIQSAWLMVVLGNVFQNQYMLPRGRG